LNSNLWAYLDGNVNKTNVTDRIILQKAWNKIDPEYLKKLVESVPSTGSSIKAKGGQIKY